MKATRWFLPESPDLLGMLDHQAAITVEGMEAFAAWAAGDPDAAGAVRAWEHRADAAKHELIQALRSAFVTPLEPEDIYAVSRGIDWVLNHAKDTVGESEVMACPPDRALADMAALLAQATGRLAQAIGRLGRDSREPTEPADAAIKAERKLEKVYRGAMAALLQSTDLREVVARRELYRRCSRIGDAVVEVAERVGYAVIKER